MIPRVEIGMRLELGLFMVNFGLDVVSLPYAHAGVASGFYLKHVFI